MRRVDPLSFDLDGDGIELINVNNSSAFFDLDLKLVASLSDANDIKNNPSNPNYNPNATIYSNINSNGTTGTYSNLDLAVNQANSTSYNKVSRLHNFKLQPEVEIF